MRLFFRKAFFFVFLGPLFCALALASDWIAIEPAHELFISQNGLQVKGDTVTMWSKKREGAKEKVSYDRYDCKNLTISNIDLQIYFLKDPPQNDVPKAIAPNTAEEVLIKKACQFKSEIY